MEVPLQPQAYQMLSNSENGEKIADLYSSYSIEILLLHVHRMQECSALLEFLL